MINPDLPARLARLIELRQKIGGMPMFGPAAVVVEAVDVTIGALGDTVGELERLDRELAELRAAVIGGE